MRPRRLDDQRVKEASSFLFFQRNRKGWVLRDERGSVIILIALALVMLLSFAALAVDVGNVMVTKNELQNISDAASLAATRRLGAIYESMSQEGQQAYVCDPAPLISVAQEVAAKNRAASKNIDINASDVIIGQWDGKTKTLTPSLNQPDAVRVVARRDGSANGPVPTLIAKVFGRASTDVSARATAALTGQSTVEPGNLIPVGISNAWFLNKELFCDQVIKFYPANSPEGCAGWHVYDHWPASESYLRKDILEGWTNGTFTSPSAKIGDKFAFTGGTLGNNTFEAFFDLFNYMKTRDGDGHDEYWTAQVVVYDSDSCSNPNGELGILGFATVIIYNVIPPNVEITAKVICEKVDPGRGGGGYYGTKGSIPGLVQ